MRFFFSKTLPNESISKIVLWFRPIFCFFFPLILYSIIEISFLISYFKELIQFFVMVSNTLFQRFESLCHRSRISYDSDVIFSLRLFYLSVANTYSLKSIFSLLDEDSNPSHRRADANHYTLDVKKVCVVGSFCSHWCLRGFEFSSGKVHNFLYIMCNCILPSYVFMHFFFFQRTGFPLSEYVVFTPFSQTQLCNFIFS